MPMGNWLLRLGQRAFAGLYGLPLRNKLGKKWIESVDR